MVRILLLALAFIAAPAAAQADPKAAVEELLAADRSFAAGAAKAADPVAALAPMFDDEVSMPSPKGHAIGRDAVLALFRENPSYKDGKVSWTPVRGGISADGTQGFTYGFLSLTGGDPARRERKYLAYWVNQPEGWRIVAYRQQVREAGAVSTDMMSPSLPTFTAVPTDDAKLIADHNLSVAAAEKAFSDRAQVVGLKQAFREYGREDAINMYSGAGFRNGPRRDYRRLQGGRSDHHPLAYRAQLRRLQRRPWRQHRHDQAERSEGRRRLPLLHHLAP